MRQAPGLDESDIAPTSSSKILLHWNVGSATKKNDADA
jgi:hypothetical protein